jgi:hypothetical protein
MTPEHVHSIWCLWGYLPILIALAVPVCLILALYNFYKFLQCLVLIRKDARENPEIYEQAAKNLGVMGRNMIIFGMEVSRLKKEEENRKKRIKELTGQN